MSSILPAHNIDTENSPMGLLIKIARRGASIAGALARRVRTLGSADQCITHNGTTLYQEAEISNHSGGPEQIILGHNTHVRGRLLTYAHGGKIVIGDWCYVGVRTEIWSMESITIGNRVLIAHGVNIHDGTGHSYNSEERHQHFRQIVERGHPRLKAELPGVRSAAVVIEDDVWINFGVTILRGVRIGRGSIIASGSVITRDVPAGVFYRCRVVPTMVPLEAVSHAARS